MDRALTRDPGDNIGWGKITRALPLPTSLALVSLHDHFSYRICVRDGEMASESWLEGS